MEDEIKRILSRAESKVCDPNGGVCTSRIVGLLARRHIVAGEFHYIGKEASTRWGGGVDLSMLAEAGALDPADETFREYERVVDPNYLGEIRAQPKTSPPSAYLVRPDLPRTQSESLRMEKTRSGLVLSES